MTIYNVDIDEMDIKKAVDSVDGSFTPNQNSTAAGNGSTNSIPIASPVITKVTVSQLFSGVKDRDGQYYILYPRTGEFNKSVELLDAKGQPTFRVAQKFWIDCYLDRYLIITPKMERQRQFLTAWKSAPRSSTSAGRIGQAHAGQASGKMDPFPQ